MKISANSIRAQRASDPNSALARFDFRRDINLIALTLLTQKAKNEAVTDAENARTDKQIGGNDAQSGTTSLVSKGGVPAVPGFAVESVRSWASRYSRVRLFFQMMRCRDFSYSP